MCCSKCGATGYQTNYGKSIHAEMAEHQMCFACNHWRKAATEKDLIIIEGAIYRDGGRKPTNYGGFLGFGGREFSIEMLDGRLIETNNLWHGGEVPAVWRPFFPDNARWKRVQKGAIGHSQGYLRNFR
jgi:hypothetical protein